MEDTPTVTEGSEGCFPSSPLDIALFCPPKAQSAEPSEFDCRGEISASLSKKRRGRVARLSLSLRMCAERRYKLLSCRS